MKCIDRIQKVKQKSFTKTLKMSKTILASNSHKPMVLTLSHVSSTTSLQYKNKIHNLQHKFG